MKRRLAITLLFVVGAVAGVAGAADVVDLPTRTGVTERLLVLAAGAALQLTDDVAPNGLVLTSTILSSGGARSPVTARAVPEIALQELRMPVLVVRHAQDPCQVCDPARLPGPMAKFPSGRAELLTVSGGESTGGHCEPFSHHGYNGTEQRVVADFAAWIRARK